MSEQPPSALDALERARKILDEYPPSALAIGYAYTNDEGNTETNVILWGDTLVIPTLFWWQSEALRDMMHEDAEDGGDDD